MYKYIRLLFCKAPGLLREIIWKNAMLFVMDAIFYSRNEPFAEADYDPDVDFSLD